MKILLISLSVLLAVSWAKLNVKYEKLHPISIRQVNENIDSPEVLWLKENWGLSDDSRIIHWYKDLEYMFADPEKGEDQEVQQSTNA